MNAFRPFQAGLFCALILGVAGCGTHGPESHDDEASTTDEKTPLVKQGPPATRGVAEPTPRPSLDHVWITGHWLMDDGKWQWKSGHWMLRPSKKAKWQRAKWVHVSGQGWKFAPGQWK